MRENETDCLRDGGEPLLLNVHEGDAQLCWEDESWTNPLFIELSHYIIIFGPLLLNLCVWSS